MRNTFAIWSKSPVPWSRMGNRMWNKSVLATPSDPVLIIVDLTDPGIRITVFRQLRP
jgi:hypothetical protein